MNIHSEKKKRKSRQKSVYWFGISTRSTPLISKYFKTAAVKYPGVSTSNSALFSFFFFVDFSCIIEGVVWIQRLGSLFVFRCN